MFLVLFNRVNNSSEHTIIRNNHFLIEMPLNNFYFSRRGRHYKGFANTKSGRRFLVSINNYKSIQVYQYSNEILISYIYLSRQARKCRSSYPWRYILTRKFALTRTFTNLYYRNEFSKIKSLNLFKFKEESIFQTYVFLNNISNLLRNLNVMC